MRPMNVGRNLADLNDVVRFRESTARRAAKAQAARRKPRHLRIANGQLMLGQAPSSFIGTTDGGLRRIDRLKFSEIGDLHWWTNARAFPPQSQIVLRLRMHLRSGKCSTNYYFLWRSGEWSSSNSIDESRETTDR